MSAFSIVVSCSVLLVPKTCSHSLLCYRLAKVWNKFWQKISFCQHELRRSPLTAVRRQPTLYTGKQCQHTPAWLTAQSTPCVSPATSMIVNVIPLCSCNTMHIASCISDGRVCASLLLQPSLLVAAMCSTANPYPQMLLIFSTLPACSRYACFAYTFQCNRVQRLTLQLSALFPIHDMACRKLNDKLGSVSKKNIEEVYDVAQLHVIIHVPKDQDAMLYGTGSQLCYHIMGLVHTKWAPIPGSIKDYIATPKTNGYQVGCDTMLLICILLLCSLSDEL